MDKAKQKEEAFDIMDPPKHLYIRGRKIEDITVQKTHAIILLKGKKAPFGVPFSDITWESSDWNEDDIVEVPKKKKRERRKK